MVVAYNFITFEISIISNCITAYEIKYVNERLYKQTIQKPFFNL